MYVAARRRLRLAFDGVGGKEREVSRLERVVIGELGRSALWFRLTCQRRIVHLFNTHYYTPSHRKQQNSFVLAVLSMYGTVYRQKV